MEQSAKTHAEIEQKNLLSYQERAHHLQGNGAEVSKKSSFEIEIQQYGKKQFR